MQPPRLRAGNSWVTARSPVFVSACGTRNAADKSRRAGTLLPQPENARIVRRVINHQLATLGNHVADELSECRAAVNFAAPHVLLDLDVSRLRP